MCKTLKLDRDFTRFFDDPTFPHKVTVCVGDKRISCSGALLAQQSSVLEKKFREDDGVLMFEELLNVIYSDGIMECIQYLHGAGLQFSINTLPVVIKFASIYEVDDLFEKAVNWLENYLKTSKLVKHALDFLKVSHSLNSNHSTRIKSVICSFIRLNKDLFGVLCAKLLDTGITGEDILLIMKEMPANCDKILMRWTALSAENGNFIVQNHSKIDFNKAFPNEEQFLSFIALLSSVATLNGKLKYLIDLQKFYLESDRNKKDNMNSKKQTPKKSKAEEKNSTAQPTSSSKSEKSYASVDLGMKNHETTNFQKSELRKGGSEISRSDKLYIGNVPHKASQKKLKALFSFAGSIKQFEYLPKARIVITFEENLREKDLITCITDHTLVLDGRFLEVQNTPWPDAPTKLFHNSHELKRSNGKKLFIGNLPPFSNKTDIKTFFCSFGRITDVHINNDKHYGFITFEKSESAYNLMQHYLFFFDAVEFNYCGYQLLIEAARR